MPLDTSSLRSRVARRIFIQFILCAIVPVVLLAALSFNQVGTELLDLSKKKLARESKTVGMQILGVLASCAREMEGPGAINPNAAAQNRGLHAGSASRSCFARVVQRDASTTGVTASGSPELSTGQLDALRKGEIVLSVGDSPDGGEIWMHAQTPRSVVVSGSIRRDVLWSDEIQPGSLHLCVLGPRAEKLYCPSGSSRPALRDAKANISGNFEWSAKDLDYLAGYWLLFLRSQYRADSWTVIVSEPRPEAFAPLSHFYNTFPLTILLTLGIVFLLSLIQIRRLMVPLEKLRQGTERVALRDFSSRVEIKSDDEFEQLGTSFNSMAARIERQFELLKVSNDLDRAVLSSLDAATIWETVLSRMSDLLECDGTAVTTIAEDGLSVTNLMMAAQSERITFPVIISKEDRALFLSRPAVSVDVETLRRPACVEPLAERGLNRFAVLPLVVDSRLVGLITLGYGPLRTPDADEIKLARQVADQVAVALHNAELLRKLDRFSLGTLTALARAIDAKSNWTAGHSERVTNMAVRLGKAIGLPAKELDTLHRGGLLHDLGKIGTPPAILDKPGKLTDEEMAMMRDHVRMGARILEPLPGFDDVLPIVLEHHEWFNGKGYPAGIAGDQISLHGRIFAVADVFDALVSERPYRPGWAREKAVEYIRDGTGSQFDPTVVEVFLELMAQHGEHEEPVLVEMRAPSS